MIWALWPTGTNHQDGPLSPVGCSRRNRPDPLGRPAVGHIGLERRRPYCLRLHPLLCYVVASTSWNIPFSALNGVISPYRVRVASFSSYRIFISSIACSVATALFIPFVTKYSGTEGNTVRGYLLAALVICCMAIPFVFTSHPWHQGSLVKAPPQQKQKFHAKEMAACFTKNPPLLIVCFAFLVYGFLNYGRMTVGMYYFTYVWGDVSLFTAVRDRQRPDLRRGCVLQRGSGHSSAAASAARCCFSYGLSFNSEHHPVLPLPENASSTLVLALLFGTGIFNGFCTALLYGMIGDTVEYGQWKTGVRADGLCSSGTSFMLKLGGAIAPTMLLAMLAANG